MYHDPDHPEYDDIEYPHPPPSDEELVPLYDGVAKSRSLHYLVVGEALRGYMVKLQLLGIYRRQV